jgi:putative copper export protein
VIGLQLDIYGLIIFAAGIYNYFIPPAQTVVMSHLHAAIWWGALLVLLGVFYTTRFYPKKNRG